MMVPSTKVSLQQQMNRVPSPRKLCTHTEGYHRLVVISTSKTQSHDESSHGLRSLNIRTRIRSFAYSKYHIDQPDTGVKRKSSTLRIEDIHGRLTTVHHQGHRMAVPRSEYSL